MGNDLLDDIYIPQAHVLESITNEDKDDRTGDGADPERPVDERETSYG